MKPIDPSPTPWDHSTWGFYCDYCERFFDILKESIVIYRKRKIEATHTCGNSYRYISYDHSKQ